MDRLTGTYFFNTIFQALGRSFGGHGTHFRAVLFDGGWVSNIMTLLAVLGSGAALLRRQWIYAVPAAFVAVYAAYYLFLVPYVFKWYLVPFSAVAVLLSARGLDAVVRVVPKGRPRAWTASLAKAAYLAVLVGVLPWTIPAERNIQRYIEENGRRRTGLYLRESLEPDAWIGCEPLGYIGYYSRRPIYDWPGLANRKVVEFQREHPDQRSMHAMQVHFAPEAIVLRPNEYSRWPEEARRWLDEHYALDREYSVQEEARRKILLVAASQDLDFRGLPQEARVKSLSIYRVAAVASTPLHDLYVFRTNVAQPPPAVRPTGLKPPQNANTAAIWAMHAPLGARSGLDAKLEPIGSTAGGGCATLVLKT